MVASAIVVNLDDKPYLDPATGSYIPTPKRKPWGLAQYVTWAIIIAIAGYLLWAGVGGWFIHSDDCPQGAGYEQCMDRKAQRDPRDALMRPAPLPASHSGFAGRLSVAP